MTDVTTTEERFDPIEAFTHLDKKDAAKPSPDEVVEDDKEAEDTEATEDTDAGDEKSTDEGDEEATDEDADQDDDVADEDKAVVKVKVDGEEREVTIGSLKRLAGQEAALTRKSQEVATVRKQLDDTAKVHMGALDRLLQRARERYEPYANLDFLAATKDPNVSGEELTAIRKEAQKAYEDVKFLEQDLSNFAQEMAMREHATLREQAVETLKVLADPEKGIQGWNEQLYGDMYKYAIDQGIPKAALDRTVDPATIKLLHKAYLYDKGQAKVKTTKSEGKKPPKRIVKSTTNPEVARRVVKEAATNKALNTLKKEYTFDNAVAAFEERFSKKRKDD